MQISDKQWSEIRHTVAADDQIGFERKVLEWVRIAVSCERSYQRICAQVRAREQGARPYLASERIHR